MTCDALAAAALAHKGEIVAPADFEGYVLDELEGSAATYGNAKVFDPTNPIVGCIQSH
jgi:hypothetical protein